MYSIHIINYGTVNIDNRNIATTEPPQQQQHEQLQQQTSDTTSPISSADFINLIKRGVTGADGQLLELPALQKLLTEILTSSNNNNTVTQQLQKETIKSEYAVNVLMRSSEDYNNVSTVSPPTMDVTSNEATDSTEQIHELSNA